MRGAGDLRIGAERLARASRVRRQIEGELEALEACARALLRAEPMLRGSVYETRGKCGKRACRCRTGEGHPMTYVTWRTASGRKTRSVTPETHAAFAKPAEAYRRFREGRTEWTRRSKAVASLLGGLEDALALEVAPDRVEGNGRR